MWPAEIFGGQATEATGFSSSGLVTPAANRGIHPGVHDAFDPILFSADE